MNANFTRRRLSVLCCAIACAAGVTHAQERYPSKPIRFLAGAVPGGATDILARAIGQRLADNLHQQVVIDNRPGANQIIAAEITAKALPDGYTIIMVPSGFTINPAMYKKLPYDPVRDFTPIALVADVPNVLVVNPTLPARSVKDFIALLRAKPGQMSYGSSGVGSPSHLCAELFKLVTNVDFIHVPYKGNGQTMIELMGGQIQLSFPSIPASVNFIKAGRMIALGVTTRGRASALPDVPTIAEAGVAGYEVSGWYGVLAPPNVPKALVTRLNGEINRILSDPETSKTLSQQGADPLPASPEHFAATIKSDLTKWAKVVAAAGIKPQ
ncbi:MAG TPA: tripartite tricarboxylate transporter substrate binding protein [Burkholderiales bacterium]|jgi:tripartite-type tricarboxylate transporter receptor subunit TctC|nr:tripartite tricarboxylate transporter substrate binding protein [Burkholderiales bacterium]